MAISADALLDRFYLKKQISKWRLLAIVFALIACLIAFERFSGQGAIGGDFIARITVDGVITDDQKIYKLIHKVEENSNAKAVIVWLDTPGGSAVGGEETYLRLRKLTQKKPVVAVMRSIAASAGYMTALGADYIIAREGTITGSIGVIIETAEVTELAQKLGITPLIVKSAPLKGSPSPFEKTTPAATKAVQDVVNDFFAHFVTMVAERRHLPRERVITLADGRIFSGKRALDEKLIDALGGEDEAKTWLTDNKHIDAKLDIKDVKVEKDDGFLASLTQSISGFFLQRSGVGLDGLSAIWHPGVH